MALHIAALPLDTDGPQADVTTFARSALLANEAVVGGGCRGGQDQKRVMGARHAQRWGDESTAKSAKAAERQRKLRVCYQNPSVASATHQSAAWRFSWFPVDRDGTVCSVILRRRLASGEIRPGSTIWRDTSVLP